MDDQVGPIKVVPLYSALPPAMLLKIYEHALAPLKRGGLPGRKIVLSTNIVETSLAIDNIIYVVDPGLSKLKIYNPIIGVTSLLISTISKTAAHQRLDCVDKIFQKIRVFTSLSTIVTPCR